MTLCLCFTALLYRSLLVNEAHPVILHVQDPVKICVSVWHAAFLYLRNNLLIFAGLKCECPKIREISGGQTSLSDHKDEKQAYLILWNVWLYLNFFFFMSWSWRVAFFYMLGFCPFFFFFRLFVVFLSFVLRPVNANVSALMSKDYSQNCLLALETRPHVAAHTEKMSWFPPRIVMLSMNTLLGEYAWCLLIFNFVY